MYFFFLWSSFSFLLQFQIILGGLGRYIFRKCSGWVFYVNIACLVLNMSANYTFIPPF